MKLIIKTFILTVMFTLGACASPIEPPMPTETPIPPSPTADLGIGPFLTVNKTGDLYLKSPYGAAINQAGEIRRDIHTEFIFRGEALQFFIGQVDKLGEFLNTVEAVCELPAPIIPL